MLSHPIYICRTIPKLRFMVLLVLVIVCCWSSFLVPMQESVAQNDLQFREFDRNMVHSPRELARDLNYLFLKSKKNPLADIDPEKLKKLRELGDDFFENLNDDQKKRAQEFAEKFMREKGLNSREGKELMDQLGVSSEMQSELAKEFGDHNPADLNRLRDLFKNSDRPRGPGENGTHNGEPQEGGKEGELQTRELRKDQPDHFRGKGSQAGGTDQPKTAGEDRPKDLFETLPNELEGKFDRPDGKKNGQANGKSPSDLEGQFGDRDKLAKDAQRSARRTPGSEGNPDGSLDRDLEDLAKGGQNKSGDLGDLADLENAAGKDAASKRLERGKGLPKSQPKNGDAKGDGAGQAGRKSLTQEDLELAQKLLEDLSGSKRGAGIESKSNKANKAIAGAVKTGQKNGSKNSPKVGGASGQPNPELDETFKSWLQLEAIKKGLRDFRQAGGPTDFQRRSLESAFKKGFKGFGESIGDGSQGGLSESEFKDKLDRVLFKAAKDSVQDGGGQEPDSEGIGGSVENTLDGLLDRVSDVAQKRKEQRIKRQLEKRRRSQENRTSQIPLDLNTPNDPFQGTPGSGGSGYGTDALGAVGDMFENIPELPAFDPRRLLIFAAIAAIVIFLLYLLLRKFSVGPSSSPARKFGRSFRGAKIHSPKDLVEAVDYFIVQKFGGRSQWWNAKHAQDMLCAGAPGYSAKISELLKDYVRARYTRADVTLSAEEQLNYKKTLQELAKEVPSESQSPADASLDEGSV